MFLNRDDLITVVFYLRTIEHYKIHILYEDQYKDLLDGDKANYDKFVVKFKPLTWRDYNELRSASTEVDELTSLRSINYETYSSEKLKRIIKDWDFKVTNKAGEKVDVEFSPEKIDELQYQLAEFLLGLYDSVTEVSEAELKKS
jgi:hypothetical protein